MTGSIHLTNIGKNLEPENLKKCLGYFEIEHTNNPCFVTVAVNPEEYYQSFEDNSFNKKQTTFSQFINKRFYFSNRIISLPLSHPYLKNLNKYKEKKAIGLKTIFGMKKIICSQWKTRPNQLLNERLYVYRQILNSPNRYYPLNKKEDFKVQKTNVLKDTRDFILNSLWQ